MTFPGLKQVHRFSDAHGEFTADAVSLADEDPGLIEEIHHPFERNDSLKLQTRSSESLLEKVMSGGTALHEVQHPAESYAYLKTRLAQLPDTYKRLENPDNYKVGLSTKLNEMRNELIRDFKERKRR